MILFYLYTVVISIYKIGFQISRNAETSIVDDHKATMKARKARGTPWSERRKSRIDRFLAWQQKLETGFERVLSYRIESTLIFTFVDIGHL